MGSNIRNIQYCSSLLYCHGMLCEHVRCRTQEGDNQTQLVTYKYLDNTVLLKISPLLFDSLKNWRIYERVIINASLYVSSFPIPEPCTSTCIQSAVALQVVMFCCFGKFKEDIFGLKHNNFSHSLKHCVQRERERQKGEREMNFDICSGFLF